MTFKKIIAETLREYLNKSLSLIRGVGKNETGSVDLFGRGLYLTDNIDVAKFYGDTTKKYNINGKIFDTTNAFNPNELREILKTLNEVLKTNIGTKLLNDIENYNDGKIPENIDYIGLSHALDSDPEFQNVLRKNKLLTNEYNSYANVCTGMNLALREMGYVGLKYSTSEIEDLDDIGLGNKNAYLIFDDSSINEIQ